MARFKKVNNERSEAIELIKLMDSIVKQNTWQIKSIGGESTLNTGRKRMFPDVFVYGDTSRTQILQGWEVKMPDVPITDAEFIYDAQRKADVLGVNSCFIWNFSSGILFVKKSDKWGVLRVWDRTKHIRTRADVATYKADWESVILDILMDLNTFFVSGELRSARIGDIVADTVFTEIVNRNKSVVAEHIRSESIVNTVIAAHISDWWRGVEKEYKFDEVDKFAAYSRYILLNWINKFTFAHMIKGNHNPATAVEMIDADMSTVNAQMIFEEVTAKCDFFNIFAAVPYSDLVPDSTWDDLTDYNAFLVENGMMQVAQTALQSVLENSVNQFKRSITGVFTTPPKLAEILVKAGITDLTASAIDPCCGTGTIAKEILTEKEAAIGSDRAFTTTYASDKSSFALQVSNLAMTRATAINLPSLLFQSNAFDLHDGRDIAVTDPKTGIIQHHKLPRFGSILSNLPFVAFDREGREESRNIAAVIELVRSESGIALSGRADLYQTLLLHLHSIAADNANVSVITSNSWLGTLAGQEFFRALNYYYDVESIVASGNGKWFDNADVITLMLFLKSKPKVKEPSKKQVVKFGLIHKPLAELSDADIAVIADSIKLKCILDQDLLSFKAYTLERIDGLLGMNIALNSFFYDVDWLSDVKKILCPVTDLFEVFRGIKTGQDDIYYLTDKAMVDSAYIGRIFKSAKSAEYLIAEPDTYALVCSKTIKELTALGHTLTLGWINRFKGHINQSVPNKETFWNNLADGSFSGSERIRLFTGMNPERRIFYGLLNEPAQINQRAIGFKPLADTVELELCHALLNSVIGVFYAEATGFPKGLGALDNRAENTKRMFMLDPRHLSAASKSKILTAFEPLMSRKIMATTQEYQQTDRLKFERIVAECFGYAAYFDRIKSCVLQMQKVRLSVKFNQQTPNEGSNAQ